MRPSTGMAQYGAALAIKPDFAEARCNLGILLAARGHLDEAIRHFHVLLDRKPGDVLGHVQLGKALAQQGSWRRPKGTSARRSV